MRSRRRARARSRPAGSIRTRPTRRRSSGSCGACSSWTNRRSSSNRLPAFARRTALLGALNSLSQLALKATMPGVPDFYQGTEFWDLSLVDPDNRRPVDFARAQRRAWRARAMPDWAELAADWPDGAIKFALTRALLALRNEHQRCSRRATTIRSRSEVRSGSTSSRSPASWAATRSSWRSDGILPASRTADAAGRRRAAWDADAGARRFFLAARCSRRAREFHQNECGDLPPVRSPSGCHITGYHCGYESASASGQCGTATGLGGLEQRPGSLPGT